VDILKTSRQALLASNAIKSSVKRCTTANRTNILPGPKYSTSESLALGYTYRCVKKRYGIRDAGTGLHDVGTGSLT